MKYTISSEAMKAYATSHNVELPFDSITFEYSESQDMLVDCQATKTVPVELLDFDTETLLALGKLAKSERDEKQLAKELAFVNVPEGLTHEQIKSVVRTFKRNPDKSPNLGHFFNRVMIYSDYAAINWCGMFLGIEKDGHTHS